MVNTIDVSARFQWNSFSSGATKTLHAYNDPKARFIDMPPTTRHQRLMDVPDWNDCAVLAMVTLLRALEFGTGTGRTSSSPPEGPPRPLHRGARRTHQLTPPGVRTQNLDRVKTETTAI